MKNETARREIESLDYYFQNFTRSYSEKSHMAMMTAIKALSQEPCEDAISRQAMHIELEKWIIYGEYKYSNATKYLYDRIDRLPSVKPQEPKTGHWIDMADEIDAIYSKHDYKCSKCGKYAKYFIGGTEDWWSCEKPSYCPSCGARMEGQA